MMSKTWSVDIERIKELPVQTQINSLGDLEIKNDFKRVNLPREALEIYNEILDKDTSFWERLGLFLTAQNKAGRIAKTIKDFGTIFLPYGKQVDNLTDLITKIVEDEMPEQEKKSAAKSSQMIAFFVLFVLSLLSYLGVDLGFEVSPDAEMVGILTSIAGMIFRIITNQPVKLGKTLREIIGRE